MKNKVKEGLRYLFALLFIFAGTKHFTSTEFFLSIMPPYLPWHLALVYISGVAEIALGVMLLIPKYQHWAAWGLIALLVAVFPANIHMAMYPENYPNMPTMALYIRLPIQGLLILWAAWYRKPKSFPRREESS